jgi:hypothetical protein
MPTTRIPPDFKEFLKSLDAHNARFLLIGGYAVNAFGYVRNTVDMDIWIASDPGNLRRVLQAIRDFAFPAAPDDLFDQADAMIPRRSETQQAGVRPEEGSGGSGSIALKMFTRRRTACP